MKHRSIWLPGLAGLIVALTGAGVAPSPAPEAGIARIIHRADIIKDSDTNKTAPMSLWPLLSTPEARMNYIGVAGRTGTHFHPDADHRLYVLEGKVVIVTGTNTAIASVGDLIVIPKGVAHSYDVPNKGDHALLLTFDAPPYDPRKTVQIQATPSQ